MTSLPPPMMPRPFGIPGMQMSAPPGLPGVFRSGIGEGMSSADFGFDQSSQVTNAPVNTKLAVRFLRSQDETYRALGAGQLIYARSMKMTNTSAGGSMNAPGAAVSLVDPMGVSALNEWLRQPAQRRAYGNSITYPSEFKFQGVQATHTDRGRSGFQGSWGEAVLTITASGVTHELPNIGMAHRMTKKGDKVFGVWQRVEYNETDFTKSYDDVMAERKLPRWDPRGEYLGHMPELRDQQKLEIARLDSLISAKYQEYGTASLAYKTIVLREIADLGSQRLRLAQSGRTAERLVAGTKDARDKQIVDGESLPDTHYWRVVPYVAGSGEAPPRALYITNQCIGHADPWYEVMTMRPMASASQQSIQGRCKKALFPCGGGDDFLKALVSIPQCEAMVCRA